MIFYDMQAFAVYKGILEETGVYTVRGSAKKHSAKM